MISELSSYGRKDFMSLCVREKKGFYFTKFNREEEGMWKQQVFEIEKDKGKEWCLMVEQVV